ncbi:MAG: 2OG-Fe(II) oxygenase family protein [Janthinobacterium lividum]
MKYPRSPSEDESLGVGPHHDSSGWLTFLYQVGQDTALEVVNAKGDWIPALPIEGSFVVNFGNSLSAATNDAVRATILRVR